MEQKNLKSHSERSEGSREILNRAALVQNDAVYQSGRSMVEMLGTLAIMGIIGMAGLSAFNYAMNAHHANELLYEVSKRAHSCIAQINMMGHACNLAEYGDKLEGYITSTLSFPNNYFGIKVAGVPEKICQSIHAKGFPIASQILPETCTATNDMIFIFDSELKGGTKNMPKSCQNSSDCSGGCDQCINGFCIEQCPNGQKCGFNNIQYDYQQKQKICCNESQYIEGVCANSIKDGKICTSQANTELCCDPGYSRAGTNCFDCNSDEIWSYNNYFSAFCRMCPNRVIAGTTCYKSCPEGTILNEQGLCLCPPETPLQDSSGNCYPCEGLHSFSNSTIETDCEKYCGKTHFSSKINVNLCCPKDPSTLSRGECVSACGFIWNGAMCQKNE